MLVDMVLVQHCILQGFPVGCSRNSSQMEISVLEIICNILNRTFHMLHLGLAAFPRKIYLKDALNKMSIYLSWCVKFGISMVYVSIGLVVTELCCHKINMNAKEKDIIRSILEIRKNH